MKTIEIRSEAKKIIKTIFSGMTKSEKKEDWKKGIAFVQEKIAKLEHGERGDEMFIWRAVRSQIINLFGKKFLIGSSNDSE